MSSRPSELENKIHHVRNLVKHQSLLHLPCFGHRKNASLRSYDSARLISEDSSHVNLRPKPIRYAVQNDTVSQSGSVGQHLRQIYDSTASREFPFTIAYPCLPCAARESSLCYTSCGSAVMLCGSCTRHRLTWFRCLAVPQLAMCIET